MTIINQAIDTLDIALAKQHLYVDFATDDSLISHHIDASLEAVEGYLGIQILETMYESTNEELANTGDGYYRLSLPFKPSYIEIDISDGSSFIITWGEDVLGSYNISYDNTARVLTIPYPIRPNMGTDTVTAINAVCGGHTLNAINQARLLMIGNWYAFRENDVTGSAKALPTGAVFLLDSIEGASL